MELEEELLRFLKKYNVKYWMEKEADSGSNGEFEIVSEKEYAKRKEECEDDFSEEEKQEDDMTNPFENVELDEEEGAFNFEIPLLEKSREWNWGLKCSHEPVCLFHRSELCHSRRTRNEGPFV